MPPAKLPTGRQRVQLLYEQVLVGTSGGGSGLLNNSLNC